MCKTRWALEPRGHSEHVAMHCSAPGFQGYPFRPADLPADSARTAGVRVGKARPSCKQAGSPSCRRPGPGRLPVQRGPRAGASRR